MGKRKMKAFYLTTVVLFAAFGAALCYGGDVTEMFKLYVLVQGIVTSGFFGGNFGEHYSKALGQRGK